MPDRLQVCIVYNKNNIFGLEKDANLLREAIPIVCKMLGKECMPVKLMDLREPPSVCDICIHLEIPCAVWFSWAKTNIMMVNSEWWLEDKWASYWNHFTVAVFRQGTPLLENTARLTSVIPWCNSLRNKPYTIPANRSSDFVWFLGGSPNKRAAAEAILPLWKDSYPALTVYSLEPLSSDLKVCSKVKIVIGMLTPEERQKKALESYGHICISKAESFGYTASESEEYGAFTILNSLPCYRETYEYGSPGIEWIETPVDSKGFADFSNAEMIQNNLDTAINVYTSMTEFMSSISSVRQEVSISRQSVFLENMKKVVQECLDAMEYVPSVPMPPVLLPEDCPPISVVTLTYNRPKFIDNGCLNLLHSDYPRDKIEWIVVDDSDPVESASDVIIKFTEKFAPGKVVYVPLVRKRSIGYKRNLGVERASNSIILMMDDDDHYPTTSFRRRVAYLLKGPVRYDCGVCTTIAMYDLEKGISAVNVPPYTLSLPERCSEATLTFTKEFWKKQPFEDVSMAEGEGFLKGRENKVVEIPPQQIIVALSHGKNLSSRKMPQTTPGCFWGFSRPLLEFLHGLIGIKIEDEDNSKKPDA
jgi:hypothetical protein